MSQAGATASGSSITTTNHAILVGGAGNTITSLGPPTNGQLPIGNTGNNPTLATITAGAGITVTNAAGSITIASSGGIPITAYVVGAGLTYTTIASAITAANAAGGGDIYIRPGTYTENLTLRNKVNLYGTDIDRVIISGKHNVSSIANGPGVTLSNLTLTNADDIFSGTNGNCNIELSNVKYNITVTSKYLFHATSTFSVSITLNNVTGETPDGFGYFIYSKGSLFFADSVLAAGAEFKIYNSFLYGDCASAFANFTAFGMYCYDSYFQIPLNLGVYGATPLSAYNCQFDGTITSIGDGSNVFLEHCGMNPAANLVMSGVSDLSARFCNLPNGVTGAGTGTITYTGNAGTPSVIPATMTRVVTERLTTAGIGRFGNGLEIKTGGAADKIGVATLGSTGANAVTVVNADVTANSIILASVKTLGTVIVPQALLVAPGAGSFVITSAAAADTSVVMYMIVQPY